MRPQPFPDMTTSIDAFRFFPAITRWLFLFSNAEFNQRNEHEPKIILTTCPFSFSLCKKELEHCERNECAKLRAYVRRINSCQRAYGPVWIRNKVPKFFKTSTVLLSELGRTATYQSFDLLVNICKQNTEMAFSSFRPFFLHVLY